MDGISRMLSKQRLIHSSPNKISSVAINSSNMQKASFEWSLKPLTIWATLIGFDLGLNPKGRLSSVPRSLVFVLGSVLFLFNLWVNVEALGNAYWSRLCIKKDKKDICKNKQIQDITVLIKVLSGFTADGLFFTGLPLVFFAFSLFGSRWNKVREQIFYIQRKAQLSEKFHRECRKQCCKAIALLFIDMALVFPQQWFVRTNSLKGLPNIPFDYALAMTVLSRLSAVTVQTIFLVCVSVARLLFKDLNTRMQAVFTVHQEDAACSKKDGYMTTRSINMDNMASRSMEYWFRYYDSVCTLVERINHCFGLILVITLCHNIIYTMRYFTLLFEMFVSKNPNFCTVQITTLIRGLALFSTIYRLWIILFESNLMRLKASRLRRELGRAIHSVPNLIQLNTQQAAMISLQVSINEPIINAMHFITIDLTWLFSLESAILSYVVLIFQSQNIKETVDFSDPANQFAICLLDSIQETGSNPPTD